jgi:glycerol-3-phosphate dehydrogenase
MTSKVSNNLALTRQQRLAEIRQQAHWDIIIIGGGITGAGILKLASQCGLKVLLVEQQDFAWGSSSRSSKMVHGGLRYIAQGAIKLTQESVVERQRLLSEVPHLVQQQSFAMSHFQQQFPPAWLFNTLLSVYDLFSGKRQHRYWQQASYRFLVPDSAQTIFQKKKPQEATGGTQFSDAMTDDARLVQRLIQESLQLGGQAINYCKVNQLKVSNNNVHQQKVTGVIAQSTVDLPSENIEEFELNATAVINATGAWAGELSTLRKSAKHSKNKQVAINIRPLRGSHIIVPSWRLPVASAISVLHPRDNRPVQIFPWQNVTVIGTTDVEHKQALNIEPCISQGEFNYLLTAVEHQFPAIKLTPTDVISTFAGIRPVVAKKPVNTSTKIKPSQEKRDHSIWQQAGLLTVSGGKLTTFRIIAEQVLSKLVTEIKATQPLFEKHLQRQISLPIFNKVAERSSLNSSLGYQLPPHIHNKLIGCYGLLAEAFIIQSPIKTLTPVSYSNFLWAELIWALKYEQVIHLDDLLLRRSRIGNVLPKGGSDFMPRIKTLCQQYLQWSDQHWQVELSRYQKIWKNNYSLPSSNFAEEINS